MAEIDWISVSTFWVRYIFLIFCKHNLQTWRDYRNPLKFSAILVENLPFMITKCSLDTFFGSKGSKKNLRSEKIPNFLGMKWVFFWPRLPFSLQTKRLKLTRIDWILFLNFIFWKWWYIVLILYLLKWIC